MRARRIVFLVSPARTDGRRGRMLLGDTSASPMAVRLRESGVPIGELFTFMSGLYFRGKLAYADAFSRPPGLACRVLVITPGLGLVPPATVITSAALRTIGEIGVTPDEPRYREPLERDVRALARRLVADDLVVLLGSIATGKYLDTLDRHLGARLRFPAEFVGRGDMSRGGLLLRCVRDRSELVYVPLAGAVRRGPRPPRLTPFA